MKLIIFIREATPGVNFKYRLFLRGKKVITAAFF
jgi:hypothetical protein